MHVICRSRSIADAYCNKFTKVILSEYKCYNFNFTRADILGLHLKTSGLSFSCDVDLLYITMYYITMYVLWSQTKENRKLLASHWKS